MLRVIDYDGHGEFCLSPLHPGPCRGPRTTRREGVRGILPGSGRLGTPPPAKKAAGRAAPAPPQRGTVYGRPAKKAAAKRTAPPAKATGRASPGARASLPPTAQQQTRRSATQDAAGAALMAMKGSDGVRAQEYADKLARRVQMARHRDRGAGNNEQYNKVVTEAALEMATILARQAGGDPGTQRGNRTLLANAISEAMRTGNIGKVTTLKRQLGIGGGARVAAAGEDCGCSAVEVEEIPEEMYGSDGPDPRGNTMYRWTALLAPIGVPTGDGRTFGLGALSNRAMPLPLRWHREDEGGHKSVVVVGTIDEVDYADTGVYGGGMLFNPDPEQLPRLAEDVAEARMLLEKGVLGPSVDLDDMEFTVQELAEGDQPHARPKIDVSKGRISAATLVQIPAFAETAGVKVFEVDATAYEMATILASAGKPDAHEIIDDPSWSPLDVIAAMDLTEEPEALLASVSAWSGEIDGETRHLYPIRQFEDGRPVVVRQAVEFALIHLDDERSLVPAADRATLRSELESLLTIREEALVAGAAPIAPPAEWFADPKLKGVTPLTVTEDGRVFGHLATWSTCHVGFPGACITAPKSRSKYAYFHTGEILTKEGQQVAVGRITIGGGHADTSLGYQAAVAHYDDATTCAAYARAGEDEHGIWLAGALGPQTDDLKAAALRAHPPSGDWRRVGGVLELMGAHAVNTPGFPVPRSRVASGQPQALVAAGAVVPEGYDEETYGRDDLDALKYTVVQAMREEKARDRRAAAAVAALESGESDRLARQLRAQELAGTFAMPAFLKKKIKDRKDAEGDDEYGDDETVKADLTGKKKKGKNAPFGGKQAPPFGKK